MIDREEMTNEYISRGIQCAAIIEDILEVPQASVVHPGAIAAIGYAVYALGEDDRLHHGDPDIEAENSFLISNNPKYSNHHFLSTLQARGYTELEIETNYANLIGETDYSRGSIARALRDVLPRRVDINTVTKRNLEISLGELYAYFVMAVPEFTPPSTIDINFDLQSLIYSGNSEEQPIGLIYQLEKAPRIVMDYGAGLGKIGKMEEGDEIDRTEKTILIDKGEFIGSALRTAAGEYGLDEVAAEIEGLAEPKVIICSDGIKNATQHLKERGYEGQVDLITMAMVQAAGLNEIEAGIVNGHAFLRPGGIFATQTVTPVLPGQAEGPDILQRLRHLFGDPIATEKYSYTHPVLGVRREGLQAIFQKK